MKRPRKDSCGRRNLKKQAHDLINGCSSSRFSTPMPRLWSNPFLKHREHRFQSRCSYNLIVIHLIVAKGGAEQYGPGFVYNTWIGIMWLGLIIDVTMCQYGWHTPWGLDLWLNMNMWGKETQTVRERGNNIRFDEGNGSWIAAVARPAGTAKQHYFCTATATATCQWPNPNPLT